MWNLPLNEFFAQQANTLGIIGVVLILFAYTMLQIGKMRAEWVSYSLLNTVGSALILISLNFYWNLSSGVIESAWLLISIYGLVKSIYYHYKYKLRFSRQRKQ